MIKTIQVNIGGNPPAQKFDTSMNVKIGDRVIVETQNGAEWGGVTTLPIATKQSGKNSMVLRTTDSQDDKTIAELELAAKNAIPVVEEKIAKYKLDMKVLSASYTFDGNKIMINFFADNRVDFRELVKDLAYTLRARIELRQVGSRDEVKHIGAMGICGQECCCKRFLNNFDNVTIKMAKNQGLALNPQRINGSCGRLLCCLSYENDHYTKANEKMPKWNAECQTPDGKGIAKDVNVLKETVNVQFKNGDIFTQQQYKLCDIKCRNCGRHADDKR